MDNYKEEIVIKRNRAVNNILHAVLCVLMVLCGLFALLNISQIGFSENLLMTIASALVYGGAAFLIWWKRTCCGLNTNTPSPTARWISPA